MENDKLYVSAAGMGDECGNREEAKSIHVLAIE